MIQALAIATTTRVRCTCNKTHPFGPASALQNHVKFKVRFALRSFTLLFLTIIVDILRLELTVNERFVHIQHDCDLSLVLLAFWWQNASVRGRTLKAKR